MLQARFSIVRGPARLMDQREIGIVMRAYAILHNMIVEDERDNYELTFDYDVTERTVPKLIVNHDFLNLYRLMVWGKRKLLHAVKRIHRFVCPILVLYNINYSVIYYSV